MKVGVETEGIEALQYNIKRLSMDVDECHTALHLMYSELSEEQTLLMLPQTHRAIDSLGMAAGRMYRINDCMAEIARAMQCVNPSFRECDSIMSEKVEDITANLKVLSECAAAILSPGFVAGTENNEQEKCSGSLAETIANESISLEMSNLAAISAVISDEYGEEDKR